MYINFIQTVYSLLPTSISINLTTNNGTSIAVHGKVDVIGNKFIGNINIGATGRQKWTVNLILNYDCKSLKNESSAKTICKFIYFIMYYVMIFSHQLHSMYKMVV